MHQIEHVVVLMMENRSFDHILGFLKPHDPLFHGLKGNESNIDKNGTTNRPSKTTSTCTSSRGT